MKIVIGGGSGQVGVILSRAFHKRGDEVVVLSRRAAETPWRTVPWDGETLGEWIRELDGADVIVNLVGYSVNFVSGTGTDRTSGDLPGCYSNSGCFVGNRLTFSRGKEILLC